MINDLDRASINVGLEMNLEKTKVMSNNCEILIPVNGTPLEYVKGDAYLENRSVISEVQRRWTGD